MFEPSCPEGATFHECQTCAGTGYVADEECVDRRRRGPLSPQPDIRKSDEHTV